MRALLVVALCLVASALAGTTVATISAGGKFDQLLPTSDATFQYLYYVTNSTWQPAQFRWDCTKLPFPSNLCTHDCGTAKADGPQCKSNPSVPSDAPSYGFDLATWPWQVRWGNPVPTNQGGVDLPSGFGFRGTYNQAIDNIYEQFWVGEAVHFNNPIWSSGGASKNWSLIITLFITDANNVQTSQSFEYRLSLDETLNECDKNDGCPWTSPWWAANPNADTRDDCPALVSVPRLPPAPGQSKGKQCCRYYTITDEPCADRVWTLDALDQTKFITVAGKNYTLNIQGFSVPGNTAIQKTYFISQENGKTQAEIYANLIDACPTSCPEGQVVVQGTVCACQCPAFSCPTGQSKTATCGCVCNSDAVNCNGGTIVTGSSSCTCDCSAVPCGGVKTQNAANCACTCPANICNGGTVSNPNDPNCPCSCPACPTGQVSDSRCNCACPSGSETACTTATGIFNSTDCTCSVCSCPSTPCKSAGSCPCQATGSCPSGQSPPCAYTINTGAACDPTEDKCIAQCSATGECVYDAIDCSTKVNLTATYGEDAPCYTTACVDGECVDTWHENNTCTLAALSGSADAPCNVAICLTTANGKHCTAVPTAQGQPCVLPSDDVCNGGICTDGSCENTPKVNQPCSDGLACTYLAGYSDPITGGRSDACRISPTNPKIAVCTNDTWLCADIKITCHSVACIETAAGAFCQSTPLPYNTSCDDGTACTVNDVCQRELEADPDTGVIGWVDNGVCEGQSADCSTDNPCLVGRCLEGGGCTYRADVRDDFICGVSDNNCTIYRCNNGSCLESDNVCPGHSVNKGAIAGAAVAGAAALALAVAIGLYARNRIANSKVFDPTTWEQLQAGAGQNNALYERRNTEVTNQLYQTS